ncbi:MAG: sugar ABC transporter ATP-binding protein [Verrucomicrobia bacterium]|nr:sugar ABC transporter ATP-binding protein [Verrucomicrobiota bacterium]MBI3869719.1 sugar ABC transporter ATP-binding protein [Verrucomicrobiota bacterium]
MSLDLAAAPAETTSAPLLEVRGIVKQFPGVKALREVNLTVSRGEVLAVVGENGAGKSTLMKILAGVQSYDAGTVLLDGVEIRVDSVEAALSHGIALIHQELNLADNLTVGANLFLGREPRRWGMVIDHDRIARDARQWLDRVGLEVDPQTLVSDLSIGRQQMVEIAKALSVNARVLIMDEPTSSLTQHEAEQLKNVIRDLSGRGVSIVYISHRLGEVRELAHRVSVLRDGANAGELRDGQITHENLVRLMVGRDVSQFYRRADATKESRAMAASNPPLLQARGLKTFAYPREALDFELRAGEIVGIAGLVGAGRTEVLQTLFGIEPAIEGEILISGKPVRALCPRDAIDAGLALVPEDRKAQGVILAMTVRSNLSLASLRQRQRRGFLPKAYEEELSARSIANLNIKTPGDEQEVGFLSGGNQQKVALGKWLALEPRILLLDEPTRGIDVGAKAEIYRIMESLAARGVGILFASSEMEEVLGLSDRALVMHEGRIRGVLARAELSEEAIMRLATGQAATPTLSTG